MSFYKNYKYVIECDESHLNQSKPGALTRTGRVQADQVWVWGATLPRQPQRFVFKVLKHAQDAVAGRPRGKEEMLECLKLLQIPKKNNFGDGWVEGDGGGSPAAQARPRLERQGPLARGGESFCRRDREPQWVHHEPH